MRQNIRTKKPKNPSRDGMQPSPTTPKHNLLSTLSSKRVVENIPIEVEGGEKEDQEEGGPAGSRPKRKRTNVYSSLSEAVIKATAQARAEAFMAAPPAPQLQSKLKPNYVHPGAVAAEKAIAKGRVPEELVGKDGNLFYCRVCLGVVSYLRWASDYSVISLLHSDYSVISLLTLSILAFVTTHTYREK